MSTSLNAPSPTTAGSRRPRLTTGWLAILLLAVALAPFVQERTAQPAVRFAQTAAMVEEQSIQLDRYAPTIGVDRVERDGHVYGDKAPLQPVLAMPFYALAKVVGADSADVQRPVGNLSLWWVTLWSSLVPFLLIAGIGIRVVTRLFGRRYAVQAVLATCGGTLLLAYSTQLYAHVLAGLLGWGCWLVSRRTDRPLLWAAVAGALGGAAVATEYPLAIVVLVVGAVLVRDRSWARLAAFAAGGVPFAAFLAGYQWLAYGSPFTISYSEKPEHAAEPLVLQWPSPIRLAEVLFGTRGMLLFTPMVAVAAWGLWRLARRGTGERRLHGQVGLAVFGAFLVLQSAWLNPWGGEAPGPRYVIPALPFLIVGMAEAWEASARFRWFALRWSVLAMATTVFALHLTPEGQFAVIAQLQNIRMYGTVPTLWSLALGRAGDVVHVALIAGVAWLLAGRLRVERELDAARTSVVPSSAAPSSPVLLSPADA